MRFSQSLPLLRAEMDAVYGAYPRDMSAAKAAFDEAAPALSPYERKNLLYRISEKQGIARIFPHDPFFHEFDIGKARNAWMGGFCDYNKEKTLVDLISLRTKQQEWNTANLTNFWTFADMDHRVLGYDNLLKEGLCGIAAQATALNLKETDPKKRAFRRNVIEALYTIRRIAVQFANEAIRLSRKYTDDTRESLFRIAFTARRIPWERPQTFYEAICAILFMREITNALEGVGISTYGHLDRMLYPFYVHDIATGYLTREEAYDLISALLSLTDGRYDYESGASVETSTTVMIGGQDAEGNPVYNDVTDLFLEAFEEFRFINPKLNARVCDKSPDAYLKALAHLQLSGANVLAIENDPANIAYLMNQGASECDARLYVGCGCQELTMQNTGYHSRAFLYVNLVQHFLNVLNENPFADIETIYKAYLSHMRDFLGQCIQLTAPYDRVHVEYNAELIVSSMLSDCLEKGLDVTEGGSRYRFKSFTLVGFGTLADSFLALTHFPDRKALIDAIHTDFTGAESLRRSLERLPRYGDTDSETRSFVQRLAYDLAHLTDGLVQPGDVRWGTSIFTYWAYGTLGLRTGATPDGRHKGTPFTRGGGPSDIAIARSALTGATECVSDTFTDFTDTHVFDFTLPFSPGTISEDALAAYIRTACDMRIPVLQMNIADKTLLREERDHPGSHPDIVVRVCGYSARFGSLSRDVQDEVIARRETVD